VRHERHYTLEEASELLPHAITLLEVIRRAREGLTDEEAREALAEAGPTNGGGEPARVVSEAFLALRAAVLELRELEIVLRDLDRGLLDFPSVRNGEEVYLCWQEGEDEIAFWHTLEAGFDGREPL
jgi:hypothetical protein